MCIFQTVRKDDLYLKEFLQILEQEGFSYSIDEPIDRKLPKMLLPKKKIYCCSMYNTNQQYMII